MNLLNGKTVNLELAGLDGNAFMLLGAFKRQAKREGWSEQEIKTVTDAARSGDYEHLLAVLMDHCDPGPGDDDDERLDY